MNMKNPLSLRKRVYLEPSQPGRISTYGNLQTLPPGYAVVGFTFYPGYKSAENKPAVNITHKDLGLICVMGTRQKINMKHSDADHTGFPPGNNPPDESKHFKMFNSASKCLKITLKVIKFDGDIPLPPLYETLPHRHWFHQVTTSLATKKTKTNSHETSSPFVDIDVNPRL
jgi:hypothetical protein